jgi:hypothetical protein
MDRPLAFVPSWTMVLPETPLKGRRTKRRTVRGAAVAWNEEKGEIFVHHWDIQSAVGKKYVISNAFQRHPTTRSTKGIVPAYDHYKQMFNSCDIFNRKLHDRKYPHRSGGRGKRGEAGHVHKFILSVMLQNIFNLHKSVSDCPLYNDSFKDNCLLLSDDIMAHVSEL